LFSRRISVIHYIFFFILLFIYLYIRSRHFHCFTPLYLYLALSRIIIAFIVYYEDEPLFRLLSRILRRYVTSRRHDVISSRLLTFTPRASQDNTHDTPSLFQRCTCHTRRQQYEHTFSHIHMLLQSWMI